MPLSSRIRRLLIIVASVLAVFAVAIFAAAAYVYSLSLSLPDIGDVKPSDAASQNTIVYAADGSVLAEWHGDENRRFVGLCRDPGRAQARRCGHRGQALLPAQWR